MPETVATAATTASGKTVQSDDDRTPTIIPTTTRFAPDVWRVDDRRSRGGRVIHPSRIKEICHEQRWRNLVASRTTRAASVEGIPGASEESPEH
jgi:hypothetical protein